MVLYIIYTLYASREALTMILTVNLGNTHITIGGYEHDDLIFCGRLHTDPAATVD